MIEVYGIQNCGSVKKAKQFLEEHSIKYTFIDFKKTPPQKEMIIRWVEQKGIEIILNTKGTTYKKLELKDKDLSLEEKISYCHTYPSLIKRPIIQGDNFLIVGFDLLKYREILC